MPKEHRRRLGGRALEHAEQAQYQVDDQNGDDQAHNASRPTHSFYPLSPEHEGRRSRGQDQSYLLTGSSGAVSRTCQTSVDSTMARPRMSSLTSASAAVAVLSGASGS